MRIKRDFFIIFFIFLIAFVLRFYKLGEVPFGFYQDESAIGYNAFSIIETGKDEYGKSFPVYFKSFGDYKLPIYIYSTIIPIKIFGLNEFAVRFPSAFFGFLSVIIFYFFIKKITKEKNLSIIATALFSFNPWLLHYNRATFEVSICLFLFLLGGLLLYKSFEKKSLFSFLIGTFCFIINIYTYNLTRFLSPILYFLIIGLNIKEFKFIKKKEIIITFIFLLISLAPFLKTFFTSGGVSSASGTLIFSSAKVLAPLSEFRSYFIDLPSVFSKLFFNSYELIFWQYLKNIVSYFSTSFFFVSGSEHGNHGIGDFGLFYIFEFPLIIFGLVKIIREKNKWFNLFLLWGLLVILVSSLTRDIPHATRSFFLIVPFEIISAIGLLDFVNNIKNIKKKYLKQVIFIASIIFVFYNYVYYFSSYYVRFPVLYAKSWKAEDRNVSLYIKDNQNKYDKIIFDRSTGFVYTSLLFYLKYNPFDFQNNVVRLPDDSEGFSIVKSFGKYEFKDVDWEKDYKKSKVLIVTTSERKPKEFSSLRTFYYPKKPVVVSLGQDIYQYPIEEAAYILVETKEF